MAAEGSQAGLRGTTNPATWRGVNRNTGKPFKGASQGGSFNFADDAGGSGKGKMTKAGGQTGAGEAYDDPFDTGKKQSAGSVGSIINFPEEIGTPKQPNYMTFRTWKITSAVGGTMGDMDFMQTQSAGVQQIALPIPTGVGTAYGQGWDQSDVNATQGALMRSFGSGFGNAMKSTATVII